MKASPIISAVMFVVVLCLPTPASAQKRCIDRNRRTTWYVYYPPDRSFRIQTPKRFRYGKDPEYKWLEFYGSDEPESKTCRELYTVLVGYFDSAERPDDPSGMYLMIGGSHTDPSSEVDITVDGFKGKDFAYSRPFDSGCKYRRGWIIDAGPRVFWVIYGGDRLEGLTSSRTMRFFKSFHPQRKQLNSKRTSNNSLDRSGGSVFRIKLGAAKVA